ncbi:MAG: FAD-dependent oxidoreductase [Ardenticatenaceae bacterium]|nr:FAD-dependent oxidoreductase [Ardenticatenaceae bacterium]
MARPADFYALVNTDREHPINWLAFEEDKPDRIPPGQSLLIVQMAPEWSVAHYNLGLDDLLPSVTALAGELLGSDLSAPAWADLQPWRYALPNTLADAAAVAQGQPAGLFVTGDALAGGRVHLALESGLAAATEIREYLMAAPESED